GLEPTIRGDVAVSVFPSATVSFSDVVLGDERSAHAALAADRLTAKLQLLPLLLGRIEPADMSLTRHRLLIALEPNGPSHCSPAADLLAGLSGDRSGMKLRLAGAPFKLAFDGSISQRPSLKLEGTLAADGKSLREALRWASHQPLPGSGLGPFALKAQTSIVG